MRMGMILFPPRPPWTTTSSSRPWPRRSGEVLTLDVNGARRYAPADRLEKLKGDRAGQHSIRINRQWRICFVWRSGDAHDVEIVDYH